MSLFNRIRPEGPSGDGTDRIPAHLASAAVHLVARGHFTGAQAIAAVNATLVTSLTGAELTDFNQVLTNINAEVGLDNKLAYFGDFESMLLATELGVVPTEAAFNSVLNL